MVITIKFIDLSIHRRHVLKHLVEHLLTEKDKYSCPNCPFNDEDSNDVMKHFMNEHAKLDTWECCGRSFWVQRDHKRHKRNHSQIPSLNHETR